MATQPTATRQEWLQARRALLDEEKALTRRSDEVAARRRALPWVRIDKDYRFDAEDGVLSLEGLFRGRSQLLIYHFMFGPDYAAGCPSCSAIADGFDGIFVHLENHDVAFAAVSRAPIAKLAAYRERMGWSFPWVSSFSNDFNADFSVYFTQAEQRGGGIEYNYRREPAMAGPPAAEESGAAWLAASAGTDVPTYERERPGVSAFAIQDGAVHHTYSAYSRGLDGLWGMYQWLDRAPLGRNEAGVWWRRHDEYGRR